MKTIGALGVGLTVYALATAGLAGTQGPAPANEKLGTVHFETSCAPAAATRDFDHAMALLHSFEFPAAIASFQQVLKTDPSCGIAEWGIAMATWGNPFGGLRAPRAIEDGLAAVGRAQRIGAKTERERAYISAVALLYTAADTQNQRSRTLAYERAMEQIHAVYPKDLEATAFYALAIDQDALPTDKSYANQLKAAALLEALFKVEPDHPGVTHYLIHSYDVPSLAARGLPYARRYANLAPDAPHALHMPAHTFTRLGLWQESIDTNIRSHDAALARNDASEALHAMDYMTYAYLQSGQDAAAKRVLEELAQLISKQPATTAGPGLGGGFPGTAIPARYALERGQWADAASLPVHPTQQPYMEAMTHFARALGAARSGMADAVKPEVDALAALREKEVQAKDDYWATQVEIERQGADAWMLWAQRRNDQALTAMTAAATLEDTTDKSAVTPGPLAPAHELLADMLMEAGRAADALKEYETGLEKEPNRFRSVYGAAHAAELAGNAQKAMTYYSQLLNICERSDAGGRAEITRARTYVGKK
jgi:tetratricopeptide (TPR) repeat protein